MKKILLRLVAVCLLVSCREKLFIDRAKEQMKVAIANSITQKKEDAGKMSIHDVKTVYENDSICLLQCIVDITDRQERLRQIEYRYIYLIDIFMSKSSGKAVYNESLQEFPCLPDDLIKKCRQDVVRNNESVYDSLYGSTLPVSRSNMKSN